MKLIYKVWLVLSVLNVAAGEPMSNGRLDERVNCGLQPSQKIDEYPVLPPKEEKQRLEKLLNALALQENSHAFIVTYAGAHSTLLEAQAHGDWAKRYLVKTHAFLPKSAAGTNSHINTLTCGYREVASTELWITPMGAAPPRCAPTLRFPAARKPRTRSGS